MQIATDQHTAGNETAGDESIIGKISEGSGGRVRRVAAAARKSHCRLGLEVTRPHSRRDAYRKQDSFSVLQKAHGGIVVQ